MIIFRVLEKIFIYLEAFLRYVAAKKDKERIEKAKDEARRELDQRSLESLTGESGNPTRYDYPGMQHGEPKDRKGDST
jgi:predicted Holliday junction resolvase-like endonuclease